MNRDIYEKAIKFQQSELERLSVFSFDQLHQMQGREIIEAPLELADLDFAFEIKQVDDGELEVSVFHYWENDIDVPSFIVNAIGEEITVGECSVNRWFNISPSGVIEWPDYGHPEGGD